MPSSATNSFLAALAPSDLELLRPHLATLTLPAGHRLHGAGEPINKVIFPHSGVIGSFVRGEAGESAGTILIGWDGLVGGLEAAAAGPALSDALVYVAGRVATVPASAFRYAIDHSAALRRLFAAYIGTVLLQAQQTAMCNATHSLEARVSRCLLEVQDRNGHSVPLTQSTVAQMLGVQRTSVNLVVKHLEAAGLIKGHRGSIEIIKTGDLERHSCECYRHLREHFARLIEDVGRKEQLDEWPKVIGARIP